MVEHDGDLSRREVRRGGNLAAPLELHRPAIAEGDVGGDPDQERDPTHQGAERAQLIGLAFESRLPAIYSWRVFPLEGGLMSFGADYGDLLRRAAGSVAKILTGTKPADLPIEPPRKFDLTINLKAAGALGFTIPPTLLARADEVIE